MLRLALGKGASVASRGYEGFWRLQGSVLLEGSRVLGWLDNKRDFLLVGIEGFRGSVHSEVGRRLREILGFEGEEIRCIH